MNRERPKGKGEVSKKTRDCKSAGISEVFREDLKKGGNSRRKPLQRDTKT